jgi:hypothetical protein
MNDFNVVYEPPVVPVGMKIVGTGVILSCLLLSALFGWGIYLNLTKEPVAPTGLAQQYQSPEPTGDVAIEDSVLTRLSPPAFTIDIPPTMTNRPLSEGQLYSGGQNKSPFSFQVAVNDLGDVSFDDWVKGAGEGWTTAFKGMGSRSVKILRTEPTDMYGQFPAVKMEIEWLWTDGNTVLTNINHYILKGDKVITLSSTLIGDPRQATDIYKNIDLNP